MIKIWLIMDCICICGKRLAPILREIVPRLEKHREIRLDGRTHMPFPLLGIDSDNGGEFINHHLYRYCQEEKINFTRTRSYRKNDSPFACEV